MRTAALMRSATRTSARPRSNLRRTPPSGASAGMPGRQGGGRLHCRDHRQADAARGADDGCAGLLLCGGSLCPHACGLEHPGSRPPVLPVARVTVDSRRLGPEEGEAIDSGRQNGLVRTHCRTGTQGRTDSTRFAACSAMRRPPQLAQTARPLQDSGRRRSNAQSSHRIRKKTMDEQPAAEEAAEFPFDEVGQPDALGARGGRGEEGLQVFLHHPVQDSVGGGARDVGSHGAGPSGFRAGATTPPQDAWTVHPTRARRRRATAGATRRCAGPSSQRRPVSLRRRP
jgi:hypothetical protein